MRVSCTEKVEKSQSFENRVKRFNYFKQNKPGFIPVYVCFEDVNDIQRYIIQDDVQFIKLLLAVRKKMNLKPSVGLFCIVEDSKRNGLMVKPTDIIKDLHNKYKHEDGFLYISIRFESVFG